MRVTLLTIAAVSLTAYALAIAWFFARPDGMSRRMRWVSISGTAAAGLHLLWLGFGPLAGDVAQWCGAALYAAGLALFVWTRRHTRLKPPALAFSATVPTQLFTSGPYSIVRHPFYVSYSLTWLAGCVATGSVVIVTATVWMIGLYVIAARREEQELLDSACGETYRRYLVAGE